MGGLPAGVVTFVFTDVKGSIRLWNDAPDDMMEALDRHDIVIDEVVKAHNGHSVKPRGEGDSRFLVFADPGDAVSAISDIQHRFFNTQWPTPRPLSIRAAVHTGGADVRTNDYYGPEVNKTARLRDMAKGGQTVLSTATHALVAEALPDGVTVTDLGEHRLRDITERERIFQLNPPGLPTVFDFEAPLLEVRMLGPLEVVSRGIVREITSAKQRAILTLLAIHVGQPLPWERIVDAIWGDEAPASGKKTVGYHISQLRDTLDPDRGPETRSAIVNREGGYVLDIPREDIDLHQFEALVGNARSRASPKARSSIASQALSMWRGDPFPGMRYDDFTQRESARLLELKLEAHELLSGARLEMGDVPGALNEVVSLVEDHPYRESLAALHAKALYRSNRQADALATIDLTRTALREDLGLSIGPELVELEEDILNQSPELRKTPERSPVRGLLPEKLDSFVGREEELAKIGAFFEHSRLVTLVGLGGIGKSRLALQAAHQIRDQFDGGAWLVELARIRDGSHVPSAIAEALELKDVEEGGVVEALAGLVGESHSLLVLDNCEHVLADILSFVVNVKDACPGVRLLATSRVSLEVPGEKILPVGPLGVGVGTSAASDLFLQRATEVSTDERLDPKQVAQVCERVGGIPLAIELAASWLRVLSLRELNEELEQRLELVSTSSAAVPERQRALTSVIDWSIEAANDEAADLLESLSVFRGGFTLDGAMAVGASTERLATLQIVDDLVSQSLVTREKALPGDSRFRLLEPVREHVGARLRKRGRYDRAVSAHREFFQSLVTEAYDELTGGDQERWLRVLDHEFDNIRSAMDRTADEPTAALPIAARIWRYMLYRGRGHEGVSLLEPLLHATEGASSDRLLGLYGHGALASNLGMLEEAERSLSECVEEAARVGETRLEALAKVALSGAAFLGGRAVDAAELLKDAIDSFREAGDLVSECLTACKLAYILGEIGHAEESDGLLAETVERCDAVPPYIEAELLLARGVAAVVNRDLDGAESLYAAADSVGEEHGFPDQRAWAQFGLGDVALSRGSYPKARSAYSAAVRLFDQVGEIEGIVLARAHLGIALAMTGQLDRAGSVLDHSLASAMESSPAEASYVYDARATVAWAAGQHAEVARNAALATAVRSRSGTVRRPPLLALVRSAEREAKVALGESKFDELQTVDPDFVA